MTYNICNVSFAYDLRIIEDNAQSIGSIYTFSNGINNYAGTIGDIGTTSFFPSKNFQILPLKTLNKIHYLYLNKKNGSKDF